MAAITLRSVKGSPLTNAELDANFSNLNTELTQKLSEVTSGVITNALGYTPANKAGDTFTGQVKVDSSGANSSFFVNSATSSGNITHLIANTTPFSGSNGALTGTLFGVLSQPTISNSGSGGSNSNIAWGGYFVPQIASSGASAPVVLYGVQAFGERSNAGDTSTASANSLYGGFFTARHTAAISNGASSQTIAAVNASAIVQGGSATNVYGVWTTGNIGSSSAVTNNVVVANYYQFYANPVTVGSSSAGGSVGTIANFYGLYLSAPNVQSGGSILGRYGIFQADSASQNLLFGSLEVNGAVTVGGTLGASPFRIPVGSSANRPTNPVVGLLRYNTTTGSYEGYYPNGWGNIGGGGSGSSGGASSGYTRVFVYNGTTTNSTETELFVDGASNSRLTVGATTRIVAYVAEFVGYRSDTNISSSTPRDSVYIVVRGSAELIGGVFSDKGNLFEQIVVRDDVLVSVDIRSVFESLSSSLRVYVTGPASKTYSWRVILSLNEV